MRSCDVISEVWEVRCEKWNCDELGCDKLWWVVMRSGPVRSGAVMSCDEQWSCDEWGVRSGAVMSWYVISCDGLWWVVLWCVLRLPSQGSLQEALCTAPATQKAAAAPAAPTRAAAPAGGSVYCACHAKGSRSPSGAHARRSSFRRLCVLRLPRKRQPRPQRRPRAPQLLQEALCTAPATRKAAAAPAAPTRAAAPPGGSVYCACHAKGSQEAICTVSEWVSEWVWVSVSECEWVCVSECVCVCEWVSEWVSQWVSEWVRGAAAADGGERRDPSEKQEPHTVMWGKIIHSCSKPPTSNIFPQQSWQHPNCPGLPTVPLRPLGFPNALASRSWLRELDGAKFSKHDDIIGHHWNKQILDWNWWSILFTWNCYDLECRNMDFHRGTEQKM